MRFHRSAAIALAVAGVLAAASATAGDANGTVPEACRADASSLCPGTTPGDGKFGKCMKEHRDKVSEGCRSAIKQAHAGHGGKHAGHAASGGEHGAGGEGPEDD